MLDFLFDFELLLVAAISVGIFISGRGFMVDFLLDLAFAGVLVILVVILMSAVW